VTGPAVEAFVAAGPAGRLAGTVAGSASDAALPILLIHGISMSRDVWSGVTEQLSRSRRIVAFDLRGHGGSDRSGPFTAEDYSADALAVLDHLDIARAHVVGTSFGGSIACMLAVRAPERVTSIVAVGSMLSAPPLDVEGAIAALRAAGVRPFFSVLLPRASFAPGTEPGLIARALDAAATGRDVETVIAVSKTALTSDLREVGARVRAPALVVTGALDATCPVPAGEAMAKILRAPFEVVPGRGHVLTMEDPDTVARLVELHVAAHEAGR
jgi:pimeloyl-ACP methyl ester carboxylesterase